MRYMRTMMLIVTICALLWLLPQSSRAEADAILGVDSTTGVSEVLTPSEAATLIGVGGQGLDANFDVTGGNTITGADESKKLEIRGSGGQATSGVNIYQHSSGKTVVKPVCAGVEGNCDIYDEIASGKKRGFKDSAGNIDFEYTESTGKISAITFNCGDAGVNCTSYRRLAGCGGDLVGIDPATGNAGHIWNKSPIATAPTAVAQTATNANKGVARYPDSDGTYGVQLRCRLPANVTIGQVDGILTWTSAGAGNYRPQVKTKCYADNDTADQAFNTAQPFTVAAGTAGRTQIDTLANITMTGCNAGNVLTFELVRSRTEGSDTGDSTFDVESFELWASITE